MDEHPLPPAPITDVTKQTFAVIRQRFGWWRWVALGAAVAWAVAGMWFLFAYQIKDADWIVIGIAITPLMLLVAYAGSVRAKVQRAFWQQFAAARGWEYAETGDPSQEKASHCRRGHSQRLFNVVSGMQDGRPVRIFSFSYTIGSGKNKTTFRYTAVEFKFTGQFPHLYLDSRYNADSAISGTVIPLPAEFEKSYRLLAPSEYEIEALQVFTPDLLTYLLDTSLRFDIELVNQELLVFIHGEANRREELEQNFSVAAHLAQRLAPVLDKMRFTEIREHPSTLNR